ncbi:MAG: glutamate--tRNA ligase [Candidatus Omnitrophica bacterium]|nr:glutamate--tRNA ligase [Candidatus Omnitrophota bacterium]
MVKVRFAPSPTGYLHIGGGRAALFNWLYARGQEGVFVLRIEDTDRQRSKQEFVDEILDSMRWLGLTWDEIYYQSQRFDIYRQYAQQLLAAGNAYEENGAILFKTPAKEIKFFDLIRGEIVFDTGNFVAYQEGADPAAGTEAPGLKDEVLIKADGSPVYSFACVVDDALMEITHVIRGEDHISNTPKQLLLYEALGFKPPKFAHMPLIMGEDGGRLSKRTGAVAVTDYRRMGFLPEAMVNYLMLLSWSPGGDQEIIALDAAVKKFTLKKVNKASAVFSMEKLRWINGEYIKKYDAEKLADMAVPFLREAGLIAGTVDREKIKAIVELYRSRMPTLADLSARAGFLFKNDFAIDPELKAKHFKPEYAKTFSEFSERLRQAPAFDATTVEKVFRKAVEDMGLKMSDIVHPCRVALTGSDVGPGLFETMAVLGQEKTIARLLRSII